MKNEVGRPPIDADKRKERRIETYVPPWLYREVEIEAARQRCSRSHALRLILENKFDKRSEARIPRDFEGAY